MTLVDGGASGAYFYSSSEAKSELSELEICGESTKDAMVGFKPDRPPKLLLQDQ